MKIIVSGRGYPEKRNIIVNEQHTYLDFRYKNIWLYINKIRQKLARANKMFIFWPFRFLMPADTQIIHLFNEVAQTRQRWVATFETELPRVLPVPGVPKLANPELRKALKLVAAPQCVAIVAMSEAARQIQLKLLEAFPAEAAAIIPKMHKLHPPQPVLYNGPRRIADKKLIFTFVGNEFYRKGGAEVVLAFSELAEEGLINAESVEVNITGDLNNRYNFAHGNFQDDASFYREIEALLARHPLFTHAKSRPNSEMIALFKRAHVGLLPSWQDTYGFSVLEMQACGCPVISTNVRALPEINPDAAGWTIVCPLNEMFELTVTSVEEKLALRHLIVTQLKGHVRAILKDRDALLSRSANAVQRIETHHNPARFKESLDAIYALAR
ncbi:D-inositol-3-phosphate glycosyltransferase (plasmid) [Pantoea sp. Nvir]|uniref:glycosyltransferase family 4 protein n=1 Tax=Pantoea sp. Nvir TaxID=2576760 RepID=UPI0030D2DEE8